MNNLKFKNCSNIADLNKYLTSCSVEFKWNGPKIKEKNKVYSLNQLITKANLFFKVKDRKTYQAEDVEKLKQQISILKEDSTTHLIRKIWNRVYHYFFTIRLDTAPKSISEQYFSEALSENLIKHADNNTRSALAQVSQAFNQAATKPNLLDRYQLQKKIRNIEELSQYVKLYGEDLKYLDLSPYAFFDFSNSTHCKIFEECPNLEELVLKKGNLKLVADHVPYIKSLQLKDYSQELDLEQLTRFEKLENFDYKCDNIYSIVTNVEQFNKLKNLKHLNYCSYSQSLDLKYISQLALLESLYVNCNYSTGVENLNKLNSLKKLTLEGYKNNFSLHFLAELTKIKELHFLRNSTPIDLNYLEKNLDLCSLTLSNNEDVVDFILLQQHKKLTQINIAAKSIKGLYHLNHLTSMESFKLSCEEIDLADIMSFKQLKVLGIASEKISSLETIHHFKNLETLLLRGSSLVGGLNKSPIDLTKVEIIPTLKTLVLSKFNEIKGREISKKFPSLKDIKILACEGNLPLNLLAQLPYLESCTFYEVDFNQQHTEISYPSSLCSLKIERCKGVIDLKSLASLKYCTYLNVSDCEFVKGLETISYLSHLCSLELRKCLEEIDIEHFIECKQLEVLNLMNCKRIKGWKQLKNFKKLHKISISGATFTKNQFLKLMQIKSLRKIILSLRWTELHADLVNQMKKKGITITTSSCF